jgi:RimJ/RimL family protein N-acetyltransferase
VATGGHLGVREMGLADVGIRIDYFHGSTDEHLVTLGVDRARLPTPADWYAFYETDLARPVRERENYSLVWELDGKPVGFSTADHIVFGAEAFMHLHLVRPGLRRRGLGTVFGRRSARAYFDALEIERLYSEPNACNIAPNRALSRAGFTYLFSHETTPGPMNFAQVTTRWVLARPD